MGLEACDAFTQILADISGRPVPDALERQRAQLLDALVDAHFVLGTARVALAADPDHLAMLCRFLVGVGVQVVTAVASARAELLARLPVETVVVGDLEDLEQGARQGGARVLISNSHGLGVAERLGVPLLRAGFPQYDWYGAHTREWVGYRGSRSSLFELANLSAQAREALQPHRSVYWTSGSRAGEWAERGETTVSHSA